MNLEYEEVKNCMWCSTSNVVELKQDVDILIKGFSGLYYEGNITRKSGGKVMQCQHCHAYAQKYIPTKECLRSLYKFYYSAQPSGEERFLKNFKKKTFKNSVLEIGGGTPGIKNNESKTKNSFVLEKVQNLTPAIYEKK